MRARISFGALVCAGAVLGACTSARTEVVVVTETDLSIPGEIDEIRIDVTGPGGERQSSSAMFAPGDPLPPRSLGLLHDGGRLGPFLVTVQGMRLGGVLVERRAEITFQPQRTLVLRIVLTRSCVSVPCPGETCERGACRDVAIGPEELEPFDGQLPSSDASVPHRDGGPRPDGGPDAGPEPDGGPPLDAGPPPDGGPGPDGGGDAGCVPEICNGADDDCDGAIDETFDLDTDLANCGTCGLVCAPANASGDCSAGECLIAACNAGFGDCDANPRNGCEDDLTRAATCGSCTTRCTPPTRDCCAGACANGC